MPRRYIEDDELQAVIEWADYHPKIKGLLIHIENERKCPHFQGKIRKKKGVRKGVSDLFLPYPTRVNNGLWIEAKGPKGKKGYRPAKVSEDQRAWLFKMMALGYHACICYGADEMIKAIKKYLDDT